MRSHARTINLVVCAALLLGSMAAPALAVEETTGSTATATVDPGFTKPGFQAEPPGGVCAPWHRCMAWGGLALAVLFGLALAVGYLVQSKGFDEIEHKQGNPEGVKAGRE